MDTIDFAWPPRAGTSMCAAHLSHIRENLQAGIYILASTIDVVCLNLPSSAHVLLGTHSTDHPGQCLPARQLPQHRRSVPLSSRSLSQKSGRACKLHRPPRGHRPWSRHSSQYRKSNPPRISLHAISWVSEILGRITCRSSSRRPRQYVLRTSHGNLSDIYIRYSSRMTFVGTSSVRSSLTRPRHSPVRTPPPMSPSFATIHNGSDPEYCCHPNCHVC